MTSTEDAATVLEDFVQNGKLEIQLQMRGHPNVFMSVANLPAEIAHLLEEIQAKDRIVQECRSFVASRDNSLQKFLKANGPGQANPKEEIFVKNVMTSFDRAQAVQEEKVALSEKAATLVSDVPSLLQCSTC